MHLSTIQAALDRRYRTGPADDGRFGPRTRKAVVIGLQIELNKKYNAGLATDGVFGPLTKAAIARSLRKGDRGNMVWLLQAALYGRGYDLAMDGCFGSATERELRAFQRAAGLPVNGIAGPDTFSALLGYRHDYRAPHYGHGTRVSVTLSGDFDDAHIHVHVR